MGGTHPNRIQSAAIPALPGLIGLLLCGFFQTIAMFAIGVALPRISAYFGALLHADILAQLIIGVTGLTFVSVSPGPQLPDRRLPAPSSSSMGAAL